MNICSSSYHHKQFEKNWFISQKLPHIPLSDVMSIFVHGKTVVIRFYSENAPVCAKWQWNARDCCTGLHDRRSYKTWCSSLEYIHYFISYQKLVNRSYIFFKFAICSIALLSLGEKWHLKGRDMVTAWRTVLLLSCYDCDSTHQHYDVTRFEYALWRRTMHEWVMNIHYQTWIAQGRFINIIRNPSKQWGVCDK